jgi:Kef-type K+ transport system membrane component KefB
LIVLNIGLDLGVISTTFFAMLVIMAVVTTMMAPPLLSVLGYRQKNMKVQESKDTEDSLKTRGVGLNEQACH